MLVEFNFKNSYSFKDENFFSMEKNTGTEFEEINTFKTKFKSVYLLKSAMIYGANASGKSNFIKSFNTMRNLVLYSMIPIEGVKVVKPYTFIKDYKKPTKYEVTIILDDLKYRYGFEILEKKVEKEWLYRTKDRETCLFDRTSSNFNDINISCDDFKKENNVKHMVSEESLFLSLCKMLNNTTASLIWKWFYDANIISIKQQSRPIKTFEVLEDNPELKKKILFYLKKADIDIEDFNYEMKSVEEKGDMVDYLKSELVENVEIGVVTKKISNFNTKHKLYDDEGRELNELLEIPFEEYQSDGTKKLFAILGPIFETLNNGGILFIDEIDSRLHCAIIRHVLQMFNSIDINKKNAQIIFNTHDVLLLEENIRRDQIWFVQKDKKGISELYCLDDFNGVRKEDNLLKKYLLGVFGAIPFKNNL